MAQLALRDLTFGYGGIPLLDASSLTVEAGERIALVGRNGAGKSTLLQILGDQIEPESGEVVHASDLRVGALWQDVPRDLKGTVYEVAASGLGRRGEALSKYLVLSDSAHDESSLATLEKLQNEIDSFAGWDLHRDVERILTRLDLDGHDRVETLSAGVQRRTLLARALASSPDLLLLDEPTNHLDIDSVLWLEEFLTRLGATVIVVSHDRRFLRRVATRIVDLDRGNLRSFTGNYDVYLEKKDEILEIEKTHVAALDKKLAEEEVWIRKGTRARRTRNEGRVRALERLRDERRSMRSAPGQMKAQAQEAERSGRLVIEIKDLGFGYGEERIVSGLTTRIFRGDRVGILGPNGVGKTTLLKLLLGQLDPTVGTVRHGTKLEVAYFDQVKGQLDLEKTIAENVGEGNDTIIVGESKRHIYGYLQDFLFTPAQARTKVGALSGGERNRVLLAKLFTKPANVLVLDEPTNDLDIDSLELLEEILTGFAGTVLLVSHDREFIDNVVTTSLVFDHGNVREFVGTYEDFMRELAEAEQPPKKKNSSAGKPKPKTTTPAKLSYRETKELESLTAQIESLEGELAELHTAMSDPGFYQKDNDTINRATDRSSEIESALETCYGRWEELESKAG